MKKLIILILLIMITFPIMNQQSDKDKRRTKFGDVFDRREDEENYPIEAEILMYKEKNKLRTLKRMEKIVWAFRSAKKNPFI